MKRLQLLSVTIAAIMCVSVSAQNVPATRTCSTMDHLQMQIQRDPQVELNMQAIEQQMQTFIQNNSQMKMSGAVVTIPVVVHVVYNKAAENITDAQVQSQITALNEDYRKLNTDVSKVPAAYKSLASDAGIEFCLAQRDPNGNATTGIIHKKTTLTSFSTDDGVKSSSTGGDDTWDASKYLNLWCCNLGGGLLGYAQFPGGDASTDGVVILYSSFGSGGSAVSPYNKGRTATHEVGHWLNLHHIWGDANCGNDLVTDTPTQQAANYGCPTFPHVTCSNGTNGDMFMDYMDYVDDACMLMFSTGQVARITATVNGSRASLKTSLGCTPPTTSGSCGTPAGLSATDIATGSATLNWSAVAGASSYTIVYNKVGSTAQSTLTASGTSIAVSGLSATTDYEFKVTANCTSTTGASSAATAFTTTSTAGACSDVFEPNDTRATAATIPIDTTNVALISKTNDVDYFKFTTTASSNIKVTLSNLPADYDLRLYNGTGTLLQQSATNGTVTETVSYLNGAAGTYYVRVIGYNGANSTTNCYNLNVTTSVTTGIDPTLANSNAGYSIFPNPANHELHVGYASEKDQKISIQVIDQLGQLVKQYEQHVNVGYNEFQYSTGEFSQGIYFVRLQVGENVELRKLVISKE